MSIFRLVVCRVSPIFLSEATLRLLKQMKRFQPHQACLLVDIKLSMQYLCQWTPPWGSMDTRCVVIGGIVFVICVTRRRNVFEFAAMARVQDDPVAF